MRILTDQCACISQFSARKLAPLADRVLIKRLVPEMKVGFCRSSVYGFLTIGLQSMHRRVFLRHVSAERRWHHLARGCIQEE